MNQVQQIARLYANKYYLYPQKLDMKPNLRLRRIQNELKEIQGNPAPNWRVSIEGDLSTWSCYIQTDKSSPFWGKEFKVFITFPEEYPKEPPAFNLANPTIFFHPNIQPGGLICAQSLKSKQMSDTVRDRIEGFIMLLSNPNPLSPLNHSAAAMFQENPNKYYRTAYKIFRGIEGVGKHLQLGDAVVTFALLNQNQKNNPEEGSQVRIQGPNGEQCCIY